MPTLAEIEQVKTYIDNKKVKASLDLAVPLLH
jgi:hypothetical protein